MTRSTRILLAMALLALWAGPALPQSQQGLQGGRAIPGDIAVVAGGTAQTLFGGVVPLHGWSVANPNASDDLWCSDSTVAATNGLGSQRVTANGGFYETPDLYYPSGVVSCVGPATGDKITARRW